MYVRTLFRGAKSCKIGKKRVCFCHFYKFGKGYDGKIKGNTCKMRNKGLFSYLKCPKLLYFLCLGCV